MSFYAVNAGLMATTAGMPQLPYVISNAVEWLTRTWLYFRILNYTSFLTRHQTSIAKPEGLVYGTAAACVSEYIPYGHDILKIALIVNCAAEVFAHYVNLQQACDNCFNAITFHYPLQEEFRWSDDIVNSFSPSLYLISQVQLQFYKQCIKVICGTFAIFTEVFKLSMALVEICLLLNDNQEVYLIECANLLAKWNEDGTKSLPKQNQEEADDYIHNGVNMAMHLEGLDKSKIKNAVQYLQQLYAKNTGNIQEIYKLDNLVTPGKITPVMISFGSPHKTYSTDRHPRWVGQTINVNPSSSQARKYIKSAMTLFGIG